MSPISSTTIDSTVAKTGRRMQISGQRHAASALGLEAGRRSCRRAAGAAAVGDRHRDALAQLDRAGGHHDVVAARGRSRSRTRPSRRWPIPTFWRVRLAFDDLVDVLVVAHGEERLLGTTTVSRDVAGEEAHAREHAGPQLSVAVRAPARGSRSRGRSASMSGLMANTLAVVRLVGQRRRA